PVRVEVVRCAQDRDERVVDVAAEDVPAPGRGDELHRALRARAARVPQLVEGRLDVVDRREDVPRHTEAALCLEVVTAQPLCRGRRSRAKGAQRARLREPAELAPSRYLTLERRR